MSIQPDIKIILGLKECYALIYAYYKYNPELLKDLTTSCLYHSLMAVNTADDLDRWMKAVAKTDFSLGEIRWDTQADDVSPLSYFDYSLRRLSSEERAIFVEEIVKQREAGFDRLLNEDLPTLVRESEEAHRKYPSSLVVLYDAADNLMAVGDDADRLFEQFGWQTVGRRDGASETVAEVMQMHRGYDWFACASRATAAFFAEGFGQDLSKAVLLGLPRIDYITKEDPERLRALRAAYPQIQNGKKNVLYVATIRKHAAIDLWPLIDAVDPERYNLIVKLHPLDRAAAGTIREPHVIMDGRFSSYDWLEAADIVVSDYSAFVLESTLREKPLYLYTYDLEEYRRTTGINMEYEKEAIGKYQFRDAGEMVKAFEEPYDFRALRAFREKYIEVPLHGAADRMADFILEKIREQEKQD